MDRASVGSLGCWDNCDHSLGTVFGGFHFSGSNEDFQRIWCRTWTNDSNAGARCIDNLGKILEQMIVSMRQ